MNTPTQQSAPEQTATTSSDDGVTHVPSIEERAASVFGPDAPSEAADDTSGAAAPTPSAAGDSPAASAGAPDAAAERRARLAALQEQERARVDAQAKHREAEELRHRIAEAERRAKDAEERAKSSIDPKALTEEQFFDLALQLNVPPDKLAGWMRDRLTNPELAAAQAAARAVDPKLSALEKRLAEKEAQLDAFLNEQRAQAAQAEEARAFHEFMQFTSTNATTAPHSARFLEKFGPQEFQKVALSAAAMVPPHAGAQAVLDQIEENLATLAAIYSGATPAPQQRPAPTPNPAAAKAPTTVSNTLAQTRAAVVDEDANWSSLPFEERSARLFR